MLYSLLHMQILLRNYSLATPQGADNNKTYQIEIANYYLLIEILQSLKTMMWSIIYSPIPHDLCIITTIRLLMTIGRHNSLCSLYVNLTQIRIRISYHRLKIMITYQGKTLYKQEKYHIIQEISMEKIGTP